MFTEKVQYLIAIEEYRNMTKAAKSIHISQPALTNYVNKLEQEINFKIFDRNQTPIEITHLGKIYLNEVKNIHRQERILLNKLTYLQEEKIPIKMGIGRARGSVWLPYIMPKFSSLHPEVELILEETNIKSLETQLSNGELDIAFGPLVINSSSLRQEKLYEEHIYLAIPIDNPIVKEASYQVNSLANIYYLEPELLNNQVFITPHEGSAFYRYLMDLFEKYAINPKELIYTSSPVTAFQLAGEGMGIVLTVEDIFFNQYNQYKHHLVYSTIKNDCISNDIVAMYNINNKHQSILTDLINIVISNIIPVFDYTTIYK